MVWQMHFNQKKCPILYVGTTNRAENYSLLGPKKFSVTQEWVFIMADLKSSEQCEDLGLQRAVFCYWSQRMVLALYRALIRMMLENGAQFWSSIKWVDVEGLEKLQA